MPDQRTDSKNHPLFDALPRDLVMLTTAVNMGFEAVLVRCKESREWCTVEHEGIAFPDTPPLDSWEPDIPDGYVVAARWHDSPYKPFFGLTLNALAVKPVTAEARRLWDAGSVGNET